MSETAAHKLAEEASRQQVSENTRPVGLHALFFMQHKQTMFAGKLMDLAIIELKRRFMENKCSSTPRTSRLDLHYALLPKPKTWKMINPQAVTTRHTMSVHANTDVIERKRMRETGC